MTSLHEPGHQVAEPVLSGADGTMPIMTVPTDPSRTVTRFAHGTGHEFYLDGHTTALGRMSIAKDSVCGWPMRNTGQVTDQHGWTVRAGVSTDTFPAGARTGGSAFRLVGVAITAPDGRTESIGRMIRDARVEPESAAEFAPVSLGGLFDQTHPLGSRAYTEPAARLWARAQRLHALNSQVEHTELGLAKVPEGTPWWKHVFVLNWAAWPDLDTINAWRDRVGSAPEEAFAYYEAGWTVEQAAPWLTGHILYPVASLLVEHGWAPIQGLRLWGAVGHFFDAWWRTPEECGDWVRLGQDPDLTVAAVRAGLSLAETATLTLQDLPTLTTMAALRLGAHQP